MEGFLQAVPALVLAPHSTHRPLGWIGYSQLLDALSNLHSGEVYLHDCLPKGTNARETQIYSHLMTT